MQEKTEWGEKGTRRQILQTLLTRLQLGHFLHVDPDALAVKQHKVDGLDGGRHGRHEVAGDSLKDQLGRRLLRETIPDRKEHKHLAKCGQTLERLVIFYLLDHDCGIHYARGQHTHKHSYLLDNIKDCLNLEDQQCYLG